MNNRSTLKIEDRQLFESTKGQEFPLLRIKDVLCVHISMCQSNYDSIVADAFCYFQNQDDIQEELPSLIVNTGSETIKLPNRKQLKPHHAHITAPEILRSSRHFCFFPFFSEYGDVDQSPTCMIFIRDEGVGDDFLTAQDNIRERGMVHNRIRVGLSFCVDQPPRAIVNTLSFVYGKNYTYFIQLPHHNTEI